MRAALGTSSAVWDRAAKSAGMTRAQLAAEIDHDKDFGFDKKHQRMIYSCEGLAADAPGGPDAAAAGTADAPAGSAGAGDADPADLSLAFKLHSRPGAPRLIVLDFTGHTTQGTAWNAASGRPAQIVTPAYDTDGNPSAFSDQERRNIIAIWRAVAEDYAAFDVDVTTEETEPATGAQLDLTDRGTRAVIGGSSYDWYGAGAGGVAYVGVFGNPYYQPAFVFPAQLGSGYPKYVWEAASHEIGHNLGLSHDGTSTAGYYTGHANWAPIMGVRY